MHNVSSVRQTLVTDQDASADETFPSTPITIHSTNTTPADSHLR